MCACYIVWVAKAPVQRIRSSLILECDSPSNATDSSVWFRSLHIPFILKKKKKKTCTPDHSTLFNPNDQLRYPILTTESVRKLREGKRQEEEKV